MLAREPLDVSVCAARFAKAILLQKQGDATQADTLMADTLQAWRLRSASSAAAAPRATLPGSLERDVTEIHKAVFLPMGGSVYADQRWNAFNWPSEPPRFVIVNRDVSVKQSDGAIMRVTIRETAPGLDNVLLFGADEMPIFSEIINALGGTRKRAPAAVMETPNQPAGPSLDILAFWRKFFAARQGHWGGWVFETYPIVTQIEFIDAERTKAAARVTVGYSGATVVLEKEDGIWKAKALTNWWIT